MRSSCTLAASTVSWASCRSLGLFWMGQVAESTVLAFLAFVFHKLSANVAAALSTFAFPWALWWQSRTSRRGRTASLCLFHAAQDSHSTPRHEAIGIVSRCEDIDFSPFADIQTEDLFWSHLRGATRLNHLHSIGSLENIPNLERRRLLLDPVAWPLDPQRMIGGEVLHCMPANAEPCHKPSSLPFRMNFHQLVPSRASCSQQSQSKGLLNRHQEVSVSGQAVGPTRRRRNRRQSNRRTRNQNPALINLTVQGAVHILKDAAKPTELKGRGRGLTSRP